MTNCVTRFTNTREKSGRGLETGGRVSNECAKFPYLATVNVCWNRDLINREIAANAEGKTRTGRAGINNRLAQ